ncbi:MAG TPA: PDZ domain-containing protein, partial [Polyangiaceae bacterium]|nr:PDZ domain-containing protein [Polyangiaceae bacterium]
DAEGNFRLDDVPPGDVAIEAYSPSKGRGRDEAVRVRAGRVTSRVVLRLRAGEVPAEPAAMAGLALTLGEQWAQGRPEVHVLLVAQGSEAERAGVRPGDEIEAIDGREPDSLEAARRALSGPEGSDVVVRLRRGGEAVTLRVGREKLRH